MKKAYKIVMLPTANESELWINDSQGGKLCDFSQPLKATSGNKNQHLYILSDEEIKPNDIWYDDKDKYVTSANLRCLRQVNNSDECFKVIASTDKSLNLPGIPQSYIEYYIEEYNEGNKIEEVELNIQLYNEFSQEIELPYYNPKQKYVSTIIEKLKLQNNEVCPAYPAHQKAQKELADYIDSKNKPQVDFELINMDSIYKIAEYEVEFATFLEKSTGKDEFTSDIDYDKIRNNFKLFFKLLSENPSFAHKSSKELNKLLK